MFVCLFFFVYFAMRFPGMSDADSLHLTSCRLAGVPFGGALSADMADTAAEERLVYRNRKVKCSVVQWVQ